MIDYQGMNISGDYVRTAVESVPEKVLGMESVARAFEYLGKVIDNYEDNYIDPDSEGYKEELSDMERKGAEAVVERYQSMLEEALYRQRLFGEQFDLGGFIQKLSTTTIHEVLDEAR